jgi:signal transduction histidine kinase
MGLGLGMVKSIVESYGGRISLKSEVGKGSKFTVFLPKTTSER